MIRKSCPLWLALMITSCAGNVTQLTQAGGAVQIVMDGESVKACTFLAPVVAREGANFRGYESNVDRATNAVRNKAAVRGATHLVLQPPQATNKNSWTTGQCNNCVEVTGMAYRCPKT